MDEREIRIKYFIEQFRTLPIEIQRAINWVIENIDLVDEMSQGRKFTRDEISLFTQRALEMNDYIMLAIVLYKQSKDQYETEIKKQEN